MVYLGTKPKDFDLDQTEFLQAVVDKANLKNIQDIYDLDYERITQFLQVFFTLIY